MAEMGKVSLLKAVIYRGVELSRCMFLCLATQHLIVVLPLIFTKQIEATAMATVVSLAGRW